MRHAPAPARGVSLIEALVALAVMAFGMLGVVGIQATLRANADVAKQRSEAVRIAEDQLEDWRFFSVLNPTTGHAHPYSAIGDVATTTIAGMNASFDLTGTVVESSPPGSKTLVVDVQWDDRSGTHQTLRMSSLVAGIAPELAATMMTPSPTSIEQQPLGRDRGIPTVARNFPGEGTSGFKPPQGVGGTVGWLFDNVTGLLQTCTVTVGVITSSSDLTSCSGNGDRYRLISGYVRFATGNTAPTVADVLTPTGPAFPPLELNVLETAPGSATVSCFKEALGNALAYYCAVPVQTGSPWSGSIDFDFTDPLQPLAPTLAEDDPTQFKVCRYNATPLDYTGVKTSLINQNFVVIRAGAGGGVAFDCPSTVTTAFKPAL
jgi:Tfp pilus assembly protein PilV